MKSKTLLLIVTLLIFVVTRGQKQQIKTASKELRSGYPDRALIAISDLEYKILNATDEEKVDYFYIKGRSLQLLAEKNTEDKVSLGLAIKAYNELLLTERNTQIFKYSHLVKSAIYDVKRKIVKDATKYSKDKNYIDSASKFYEVYQLDTNDKLYLYYAAFSYLNGENYAMALKYFTELKRSNYSGKVNSYFGLNKSSGKEDEFFSKKDLDNAIKLGTHEKLIVEMEPPRKENILRNIAIIYLLINYTDNAKMALLELYVRNPSDTTFDLAELMLYLETKDYLTFKNILIERIDKKPNDAHLYYYLSIISQMLNNKNDTKKYVKKATEINPSYDFSDVEKSTSYAEAIKILKKSLEGNQL